MRALAPISAFLALFSAGLLADTTPANSTITPYAAPEFVVNLPAGKQLLLSSLRGKVVVMEFLFTTCPHCQHASQVFTQLYSEFGSRGFQPVGVAFNEDQFTAGPERAVVDFVKMFRVGYPVGWSERAKVLDFLGVTPFDRLVVPQIVWIDRKGMIRSKTMANGDDTQHYREEYWREMIETLTKEPAGSARHTAHRAARK